jgi:hypothetical protein
MRWPPTPTPACCCESDQVGRTGNGSLLYDERGDDKWNTNQASDFQTPMLRTLLLSQAFLSRCKDFSLQDNLLTPERNQLDFQVLLRTETNNPSQHLPS